MLQAVRDGLFALTRVEFVQLQLNPFKPATNELDMDAAKKKKKVISYMEPLLSKRLFNIASLLDFTCLGVSSYHILATIYFVISSLLSCSSTKIRSHSRF